MGSLRLRSSRPSRARSSAPVRPCPAAAAAAASHARIHGHSGFRRIGGRVFAAFFQYSNCIRMVTHNPAPERIVIASRESRLALWQAEHVREALAGLYPGCRIEILGMTTRGDKILDRPLAKVGGKGLFVKELENALLDGSADLAVHSMKD